MKRVGNLMQLITDMDNMREAFLLVMRGKSGKYEAERFRESLDINLAAIAGRLAAVDYDFGGYRSFIVHEPKARVINAAPFATRVALQAMMRVCHRVFDDYQIFDSYASRIGKGTYKALDRARHFVARYQWFAKLDVRKFFDNIDHEVMMGQLCRLFKDKVLLSNFRNLLDSYEVLPSKGLPIGNLSSQYFANHYMAAADRFAKEQLRVPAMVRYMDDVVMFSDDKSVLLDYVKAYSGFLNTTLRLSLHEPVINRTLHGLPFLGYVVHDVGLRLNQNSRRRFRRRFVQMAEMMDAGILNEEDCLRSATAMLAFVEKAESLALRKKIMGMLS